MLSVEGNCLGVQAEARLRLHAVQRRSPLLNGDGGLGAHLIGTAEDEAVGVGPFGCRRWCVPSAPHKQDGGNHSHGEHYNHPNAGRRIYPPRGGAAAFTFLPLGGFEGSHLVRWRCSLES